MNNVVSICIISDVLIKTISFMSLYYQLYNSYEKNILVLVESHTSYYCPLLSLFVLKIIVIYSYLIMLISLRVLTSYSTNQLAEISSFTDEHLNR